MSFGSSTRFQTGTQNGKPAIFWEQQSLSRDTKKKFYYKDKSNKHPLRQVKQKSLEETSPAHKPPAGTNKPTPGTGNRTTAPKPPGPKGAAASKDANGGSKPSRTAAATKKGASTSDPSALNAGTVTLTQNQLNTILETIGRLTISNQELTESQKAVVTGTGNLNKVENDQYVEESIYKMGGEDGQTRSDPNATPEHSILPPSPDSAQHPVSPSRISTGPETQNETNPKGQRTNSHDEKTRQEERSGTSLAMPSMDNNNRKTQATLPHKTPLSKAELKRLQWEKERLEATAAYNPWGKPGAGAPIRDVTGNVVADYKIRKDQLTRQSQEHLELEKSQNAGGFRSESSQTGHTGTIADRFKDSPSVEPAAMRSSFTLGAVAPNGERFNDVKAQQKKQWLEDLERQREEQRLRKEAERQKLKEENVHDTWADKMGGYKPQPLPRQERAPQATVDDTAALPTNRNSDGSRTNSAPTEKTPADPLLESQAATFLRGQNVMIDPDTQKEMEEKRKRHLEHQEYIKKQVEEKQRLKREERERKIREEMEEEKKLQAERQRLQNLYEMEQQKQRSKEENARKRLDDLKKAMDEAKEQAEREKHEKRLRKLEEGGHQTARYHENFEAHRTPRPFNQAEQDSVVHVEPTYVPGLNLNSVRGEVPSTKLALPEPYTENRLLTPSQYRGVPAPDPSSPRREFGTQTDPNVAKQIKKALRKEESSDTTDAEYGASSKSNKKVRVKSASKEDKEENNYTKDVKNRPKWGQGGTKKSKPLKNSDKDPSYQRNRKQREARRKERQERLLAQADKFAKYIPGDPTAASRARSRSPPLNRTSPTSRSPPQGRSRQTLDSRATQRSRSVRSVAPSPPVPALLKPYDPVPQMESDLGIDINEGASHSRMSQRSRTNNEEGAGRRAQSPPVPAIKHRSHVDNDYNVDAYNYDTLNAKNSSSNIERKDRVESRGQSEINGQFVPFVRSTNVLDPAHAESPVPVSRENTAVERARRAYIQNTHPANYGVQLDNIKDKTTHQQHIPENGRNASQVKDPIMNPDLVKKVPSERQGQILQQLTELRKGLLMKQRELEIMAPLQTVEVE